jgi:tetratricopeptide (TPR) repeat protein
MPHYWAETQTALGKALVARAQRTPGEAGDRLVTEAIERYRQALEVYTREYQPQSWATTQTMLGAALGALGMRSQGHDGAQLLGEAVAAQQRALEVHTREYLPQSWAMTQHYLGEALAAQGRQAGGEAGRPWLEQAVAAYQRALEVRTREDLSGLWAQTHRQLADVYLALKDWPHAVASYTNVLQVVPGDSSAYHRASELYHNVLFKFADAFAVDQRWVEEHPEDLAARSHFAERHFTTGRFDAYTSCIIPLLEHPAVALPMQIALRAIEIANMLALQKTELVPGNIEQLQEIIASQPEDFTVDWSFAGTKYFVSLHATLAPYRTWLLPFFEALEGANRQAILGGLQQAQAHFHPF